MDEQGYEVRLFKEFGISLDKYKEAIGHPGGVHGDNMYLIAKLMQLPEVSNVIEFGSGLSSLVLGKLQEVTRKGVVSLEDWPHWAGVGNSALEKLGLSHRVISTQCDPERCPDFRRGFEVAFLDGNIFHGGGGDEPGDNFLPPSDLDSKYYGRAGALFYYEDVLQDAVLIWDDAESLIEYIHAATETFGRDPAQLFWFNPTDRTNRKQLISLPEKNKGIYRKVIDEVASL